FFTASWYCVSRSAMIFRGSSAELAVSGAIAQSDKTRACSNRGMIFMAISRSRSIHNPDVPGCEPLAEARKHPLGAGAATCLAQDMPVRVESFVVNDDLDAVFAVIERHEAHPASARGLAAQRRHHPGDAHRRGRRLDGPQRYLDQRRELQCVLVVWVAREVITEARLFVGQPLLIGPRPCLQKLRLRRRLLLGIKG